MTLVFVVWLWPVTPIIMLFGVAGVIAAAVAIGSLANTPTALSFSLQ